VADTRKDTSDGLSEGEALLAFSRSTIAMVLTDARQDDNPIVYVNRAFERVTGYSAESALGRNCRFLQGPDTDPSDVAALRAAVASGEEISVDLLNYRADGRAFRNRLAIAPILDQDGEISYFLGIQKELREIDQERRRPPADRSMVELQHRVKNHLSMIVGLVRVQARSVSEGENYATLARRIESLQLLYEELSRPDMGGRTRVSLGAYLGRVVSAISHLDGRAGVHVNVDVAPIYVDAETALRLGLVLSEVLTNCLQHAFTGRNEGTVDIRVRRLDGGGIRLHVADDGVGLAKGVKWPNPNSLGGRIVGGLIEGLNGSLDVLGNPTGTVVNLDVPAKAVELSQ
jgi:PAS domain S-box-containing protein